MQTINQWKLVLLSVRQRLALPRWKNTLLGTEKILQILQNEGFSLPILSHFSIRYDIGKYECGSLFVTAMDQQNCRIEVLDGRLEKCFFMQEVEIQFMMSAINEALETTPPIIEKYFIDKYSNQNL